MVMQRARTNETDNAIGSRLHDLRIGRDLTLAEMAAIIRLTPSALWKIERGVCRPNERTTFRILRAFPEIEVSTSKEN